MLHETAACSQFLLQNYYNFWNFALSLEVGSLVYISFLMMQDSQKMKSHLFWQSKSFIEKFMKNL